MTSTIATSNVQRVRLLYKTILKLHRGLPLSAKAIGDIYVKDEFKRHKQCNESEATLFMKEWTVSRVLLYSKMTLHEWIKLACPPAKGSETRLGTLVTE